MKTSLALPSSCVVVGYWCLCCHRLFSPPLWTNIYSLCLFYSYLFHDIFIIFTYCLVFSLAFSPFFWPDCHNFLGQSSPFFVHPSPVRHVLSSFARIIAIVVVSVISFIIKVSVLEMETLWRWCLEVNKDFKLTRLLCWLALSVTRDILAFVVSMHFSKCEVEQCMCDS